MGARSGTSITRSASLAGAWMISLVSSFGSCVIAGELRGQVCNVTKPEGKEWDFDHEISVAIPSLPGVTRDFGPPDDRHDFPTGYHPRVYPNGFHWEDKTVIV